MFSFFHPKPVVDGRAVAVKVVQQKSAALQDTHTLIVATRGTAPANVADNAGSAGNACGTE